MSAAKITSACVRVRHAMRTNHRASADADTGSAGPHSKRLKLMTFLYFFKYFYIYYFFKYFYIYYLFKYFYIYYFFILYFISYYIFILLLFYLFLYFYISFLYFSIILVIHFPGTHLNGGDPLVIRFLGKQRSLYIRIHESG